MFYPQKIKNAVTYSVTTFCEKLYALCLVVPPGIEPGTQGFSVLSLKTFKSLAYGSTFKGNQLSYCTLAVIL